MMNGAMKAAPSRQPRCPMIGSWNSRPSAIPRATACPWHCNALQPGAQLKLSDAFGSITYKGPGTFIAAGTGVTPFLGILRQLAADDALDGHKLLLTNKTERDLICEKELKHYLGDDCVLTFTREHDPGHQGQRIDVDFLETHLSTFDGMFYVCGPNAFVESINDQLQSLGVRPEQLVYKH